MRSPIGRTRSVLCLVLATCTTALLCDALASASGRERERHDAPAVVSVHTSPTMPAPEAVASPAYVEFNGQLYLVEKTRVGGQEIKTYWLNGVRIEERDLREFVAAQSPRVIASRLEEKLAQVADEDLIDVVVMLSVQPGPPIAREVRARIQPQVDQFTAAIQTITRQALPQHPINLGQERDFRPAPIAEGDQNIRRQLAGQLDDLKHDAMQEIFERAAVAAQPSQDALADFIEGINGEITARITAMNFMGARIPAGQVAALAQHPLVASIDFDHPGEPELDNHQHSLGLVTGFWANGITGGVHDCGVLDTGVYQAHPSLSSHTFLSNAGTGDSNGHGTGMAGIMASTHTLYRGMAFGLDKIVVAIAGNDTTSMTGMNYIASTGEPENVNYSFGNGTANSNDYANIDRFFDGVISTFGYMVSKSTGNGGYHATNPTITHPAPAYNLMASANMDDFNTVTRADDRITSSSSVGPTVAGRKKPDITAPGNNSMSTNNTGGFSNIGGTSSASPHTGGGIILLYDLGVTDVMAGKAILINTAEAMTDNGTSSTADDQYVPGSLWNRRYGWGYLHLGKAYANGLDYFIDEIPWQPENADFKLYKGPMQQYDKATLVWQRHVAYNGNSYPTQIESLSDLDLFAFRESTNTLLASSTSAIDNVEQLHSPSNEGSVVLKVEAFGQFDPDIPLERFALATAANFTAATGPVFNVNFSHPGSVDPGQVFNVSATITNAGDLRAHAVAATFAGMNVVNGPNPASLGSIAAGAQTVVTWTVQAPTTTGSIPVTVTVQSNSYGENFTGVGSGTIGVGVGGCVADITGDNVVNLNDLLIVINAWGPCGNPCPADVAPPGGDGIVNVNDLLAVINAWGPCP